MQEAFARALVRWKRIEAMQRPVGWVLIVALNEARRRLRRSRFPAVEIIPERSTTCDWADQATSRIGTQSALESLAPRQRLAIYLRYYADLPMSDISKAMDCSVGTVKATLHAAIARLREMQWERDE